MGNELIRSSSFVYNRLKFLQSCLDTLPPSERPDWSMEAELRRSGSSSRIDTAELSQPLTTAIQIILVDLFRILGVEFAAVVGHSSGEVVAAYAAGYISAGDAIKIAYYRGFHAKRMTSPRGAMLSVGLSFELARKLCEQPTFRGRLYAAAENSSTNTTLSGDLDAILQARSIFLSQKMFCRPLKIDIAYHSAHMIEVADSCTTSLRGSPVTMSVPEDNPCVWRSTVYPGRSMDNVGDISDAYWRDNLVAPVMFATALKDAVDADISAVLEIGPHPVLKSVGKTSCPTDESHD